MDGSPPLTLPLTTHQPPRAEGWESFQRNDKSGEQLENETRLTEMQLRRDGEESPDLGLRYDLHAQKCLPFDPSTRNPVGCKSFSERRP